MEITEIISIIIQWFSWGFVLSVVQWVTDFLWLTGTLFLYLYAIYAVVKITWPWVRG